MECLVWEEETKANINLQEQISAKLREKTEYFANLLNSKCSK